MKHKRYPGKKVISILKLRNTGQIAIFSNISDYRDLTQLFQISNYA